MGSRTVHVPGISCGHCVATIERELSELPGVTRVKGDAADKSVTIEWDDGRTDWPTVRQLMEEIQFAPQEA